MREAARHRHGVAGAEALRPVALGGQRGAAFEHEQEQEFAAVPHRFPLGRAGHARDLDAGTIAQYSINPNDVGVVGEYGSDIYWNPEDIAILVQRWLNGPQG